MWEAILATGQVVPYGLDAVETLRQESGLIFLGYDYFPGRTDPYEMNLDHVVRLEKPGFRGRPALRELAAAPPRRLTTLLVSGDQPPDYGAPVWHDGDEAGQVRSACWSPSFDRAIAMAVVDTGLIEPGRRLTVELASGGSAAAEIAATPCMTPASCGRARELTGSGPLARHPQQADARLRIRCTARRNDRGRSREGSGAQHQQPGLALAGQLDQRLDRPGAAHAQVLDLDAQRRGLVDQPADRLAGRLGSSSSAWRVAIDCGQNGISTASTTISLTPPSMAAWIATRAESGSNGTASVASITGRHATPPSGPAARPGSASAWRSSGLTPARRAPSCA